ncbi:bromodomain-containing protein DDB_G0280777-like isoform X2 [Dysidea avara]
MMWVCACCKPERNNRQRPARRTRFTRKYIEKSTSLPMDKVPVLEDVEEVAVNDEELERRLSDTNLSRPSLEVIDNQVWRSNENLTNIDGGLAASCEDLSPKQTYVRRMNYSESENDFHTLRVDETLFEGPSTRSKSEAQLSKLGVSAVNPKELLEFYDMEKPHNSPRKKDCFSTGDVSISKLATNMETLLQEELESPERPTRESDNQKLTSQPEIPEPASQENNQQQTSQDENPQLTSQADNQQITNQHDIPQSTSQQQTVTSQQDAQQSTNQQNIQQSTSQHDTQETTKQPDNQQKDIQDGDDQPVSTSQPSQEDTTSDTSEGSLRERLTGTPDSGVVLSEETSSQDQSSIKQEEKHDESDGATGTIVSDHDALLSTYSSAPQLTLTNSDSFVTEKPHKQTRSNDDSWEPVANRKQRYLEMIEQDSSPPKLQSLPRSQPLTRKQIYKPKQTSPLLKSQQSPKSQPLLRKHILLEDQESEKDSDFDEELLSSSQPMLNLTNDEEPKPSQRTLYSDSDSESETEEMQAPLIPKIVVTNRLEAKDDTHIMNYTNPSFSDSSDDDIEMVKPDRVVVHRPPTKTAKGEQQRASHPPLQRTIRNEYFGSGVLQQSTKRRKHQPKLNSIIEEDH